MSPMSQSLAPQLCTPDGGFVQRSGFQSWLILGLFLGGIALIVAQGVLLILLWSSERGPPHASYVVNVLGPLGAVLALIAVGLSIQGILSRRLRRGTW